MQIVRESEIRFEIGVSLGACEEEGDRDSRVRK